MSSRMRWYTLALPVAQILKRSPSKGFGAPSVELSMGKLDALRSLRRSPPAPVEKVEPPGNPAPLSKQTAPVTAYKAPTAGAKPRPAIDPLVIAKPPTGRCTGCERPSRLWVQAWKPEGGWRYFQNGVEFDGPSASGYCTESCAVESNPSRRVVFLRRSLDNANRSDTL
jgi:hypothetical protein